MNPERNKTKKAVKKLHFNVLFALAFTPTFESSSFLLPLLTASLLPILAHTGEFSHSCHARHVSHCSQTSPRLHTQSLVSYCVSISRNFYYIPIFLAVTVF